MNIDDVREAMTPMRERIDLLNADEYYARIQAWLEPLFASLPATKSGTMKAWFQAHHLDKVDTVQFDHNGLQVFFPRGRVVDAVSRAGAVCMNDSWRDYAGCSVIASSETVLVVDTGDKYCIYQVVSE